MHDLFLFYICCVDNYILYDCDYTMYDNMHL